MTVFVPELPDATPTIFAAALIEWAGDDPARRAAAMLEANGHVQRILRRRWGADDG